MSSSGFVPMPFAKRVQNEYCVSERTWLSVLIVPVPSWKLPFQTADAFRFNDSTAFYLSSIARFG